MLRDEKKRRRDEKKAGQDTLAVAVDGELDKTLVAVAVAASRRAIDGACCDGERGEETGGDERFCLSDDVGDAQSNGAFSRCAGYKIAYPLEREIHNAFPRALQAKIVSELLIDRRLWSLETFVVSLSSIHRPGKMSGCGNDKCTCGTSCSGCRSVNDRWIWLLDRNCLRP